MFGGTRTGLECMCMATSRWPTTSVNDFLRPIAVLGGGVWSNNDPRRIDDDVEQPALPDQNFCSGSGTERFQVQSHSETAAQVIHIWVNARGPSGSGSFTTHFGGVTGATAGVLAYDNTQKWYQTIETRDGVENPFLDLTGTNEIRINAGTGKIYAVYFELVTP